MSMIKDLCLIAMFLFLIIKYVLLYRDMLKQRGYFVDTLSHDLRVSAIAQIRGIDLLKKNTGYRDNNIELIYEIDKSCKFTLEMITMLLNTYKFQNKEQFLEYKWSSVENLTKKVINELNAEAKNKDINLNFKICGESFAYIDEKEINKVVYLILSTVISNAQKTSIVEVLINSNENQCKVDFVYSGLPLTEEESKRMFFKKPRFSTVGHGIKMHLCKKIIDFHKGKIFVEKCAQNKNKFTLILPKAKQSWNIKSFLLTTLQPYNL